MKESSSSPWVWCVAVCLLLVSPAGAAASDGGELAEPFFQFRINGEMGFLAPAFHSIILKDTPDGSPDATRFDLVDEGGQDNLFLFLRFSAEMELDARHLVVFLYQPLTIRTAVSPDRDLVLDEVSFPSGTPMDIRYGFDFYRLSYLYDFYGGNHRHELALGTSMQIRNATINFTSADGTLRVDRRDIGPVPLIKLRGRYGFESGAMLGFEVDGIWAPIRYFNGSDNETEGALLDLSLRAGYRIRQTMDLFINLRYLTGGAASEDTTNWLHFVTVSLGVDWSLGQEF